MKELSNDQIAQIKSISLLTEIKEIEKLNEVARLRKRRDRADAISQECTRRIIAFIYEAKDKGVNNKAIAEATGYTPSYIKNLLSRRRLAAR